MFPFLGFQSFDRKTSKENSLINDYFGRKPEFYQWEYYQETSGQ